MTEQASRKLLYNYFEQLIERKRTAGRHSTADLYRATANWVKRFAKERLLVLNEINTTFVDKFHTYLQSQKLKANSIVSYMCNFRAMYNMAVRERIIHPRVHPFSNLILYKEKTAKRAISAKEIEKICLLDLQNRADLSLTADMCIFSFLSCGMPFVDLAHLTQKNIIGAEIVYNRIKTGTLIRIRITEGMKHLLNKYKGRNATYLFPILTQGDKTTHEEYKLCLLNYNTNLKEIGEMLGILTPLTSYVIRHSWATEALRKYTPIAIISQALGHTSEKTTRFYLDQLDQSELDQANALITNAVDTILRGKAA